MLGNLIKAIIAIFIIVSGATLCARAQDSSMEEAKFYGDSSLIRSFLLVTDGELMRYNLVGGSDGGLKHVELMVSDVIINRRECSGALDCSLSGTVLLGELPSSIITAIVEDSTETQQVEKLRIDTETNSARVYFVGMLPGVTGSESLIIASSDHGSTATSSEVYRAPEVSGEKPGGNTSKEITVTRAPGPELRTSVKKNADNDYSIVVRAIDPKGVDFIEILENGKFLDVQMCDDRVECRFEKRVRNRQAGRNRYIIKSMNNNGTLTFKEELLFFTEQ